jgi:GntR family transcriptional regulator
MSTDWNDSEPIYRQIKARVVTMLLEGLIAPGGQLPSVRQIAADFQLNPITVSRAYQELVDDGLIEMRRGMGMFVTEGAPQKLLANERERFMQLEWPRTLERMEQLGIAPEQLLSKIKKGGKQ